MELSELFKNIDENENLCHDESYLEKIVQQLNDLKDIGDTKNILQSIELSQISNLLIHYKSTRTYNDCLIYDILSLLENYGYDLSTLHPMVFGESSRKNYENLKKLGVNLHVKSTPDNAIKDYINRHTLWNTLKYHVREVNIENAEKIYDIRFILRFLYGMLQPGSSLSCKLFVEHNCLSFLFACTSSSCVDSRSLAYACLQRYANLLQELKLEVFPEKSLILYLIRMFKHSLEKPLIRPSNIITHFFARVAILILHPENNVYSQVMAFLSMKPIFDLENIPEFFKLLYSSSPEHHNEEREWILTLISEGILEPQDYQVLQNRNGVRLLLTSFSSIWLNRESRALILKTLQNIVVIPSVAHDLLSNEGVHMWIALNIDSKRFTKWEKNFLAQIFASLIDNERKYQRGVKGKNVNACLAFHTSAKLCAKKIIAELEVIGKMSNSDNEKLKALETIERISNVINKKWKMKKKFKKL